MDPFYLLLSLRYWPRKQSEEQEALEKEAEYTDKNSETMDEEEEMEIEEIDFNDIFNYDDDK